jgi:hypothetical protein
MAVTNILAYYDTAKIASIISVIVQVLEICIPDFGSTAYL